MGRAGPAALFVFKIIIMRRTHRKIKPCSEPAAAPQPAADPQPAAAPPPAKRQTKKQPQKQQTAVQHQSSLQQLANDAAMLGLPAGSFALALLGGNPPPAPGRMTLRERALPFAHKDKPLMAIPLPPFNDPPPQLQAPNDPPPQLQAPNDPAPKEPGELPRFGGPPPRRICDALFGGLAPQVKLIRPTSLPKPASAPLKPKGASPFLPKALPAPVPAARKPDIYAYLSKDYQEEYDETIKIPEKKVHLDWVVQNFEVEIGKKRGRSGLKFVSDS